MVHPGAWREGHQDLFGLMGMFCLHLGGAHMGVHECKRADR